MGIVDAGGKLATQFKDDDAYIVWFELALSTTPEWSFELSFRPSHDSRQATAQYRPGD
jgi:hypothetical protein